MNCKMFKKIVLLFTIMLLSSCAVMLKDFDKYEKHYGKIPFHLISVGDSKKNVSNSIGEPNSVPGSRMIEGGTLEVWEYEVWALYAGPDQLKERYWLYFFNGKLLQWGRPGDWDQAADKVYEFRNR